ncbi:hypothetical protein HD806DRAFT_288166 [Xylariaceae sp. AK1471]|nr:hypothetical protein HD806DRAFT_288166 [Xylariaceae sp. AK1471]
MSNRERIRDWINSLQSATKEAIDNEDNVKDYHGRPAKRVCYGLDDNNNRNNNTIPEITINKDGSCAAACGGAGAGAGAGTRAAPPFTPPLTNANTNADVDTVTDTRADMDTISVSSGSSKRALDHHSREKDGGRLETQARRPILPLPRRRKSTSPKKTRSMLETLQKPFNLRGFPVHARVLEQLPQDVKSLYKEIRRATREQGILPLELQKQLTEQHGAEEYAFKKPDAITISAEAKAKAHARAATVYGTLCEVMQKSSEALIYERHESTWNCHVHTPLLELVFASSILGANNMVDDHPLLTLTNSVSVRYELVFGASITPDSLPMQPRFNPDCSYSQDSPSVDHQSRSQTGTETEAEWWNMSRLGNRGNNKRVDYVLVMDMPKTARLQQQISRVINSVDCCDVPHVNQTVYRPVEKSPIAVSIETKSEIPRHDPLLQLGIWATAWHSRMYALRASIAGPNDTTPLLVTMPLIQVVGHVWRIYFACDVGTSIDLYGPMTIGSTEDIISMYVLLASLEAIKNWIETTFQDAMVKWFMVTDDPPTSEAPVSE